MPVFDSLNWWSAFWDILSLLGGIVGLFGLFLEFKLESRGIKKVWKPRLKNLARLLLISGIAIPTLAQFKTSQISDQKVAYLNKQSAAANERAASAEERAGIANRLAAEANDRAGAAIARAASIEKDNLRLKIQLHTLESDVRPRQLNDDERHFITRNLNGRDRTVTVVRLNDAEPRLYADQIVDALRGAGFVVKTEDTKVSLPQTGVIFCEKDPIDLHLFDMLRKAKIDGRVVRVGAKDRPDFCDAPGIEAPLEKLLDLGTLGYLTPETVGRLIARGTASFETAPRIFIGQRIPRKR